MNFLNIAENRYTTKKYDATKIISEDKIEALKQIVALSPSSINSQPWRFSFVSKGKTKDALAEQSYFNEGRIKDASHLVIFSAVHNINFFENQINANLPEGAVGYYNQFIKPEADVQIKSWMAHQVYLSLGVFLSACASMQIDSTPMEGIKPAEYAEILKLDNHTPLFAVAVGYRDINDNNQPSVKPKSRLKIDTVIQSL